MKWTENHCPIAGRAAEYDYLGFFTAISRDSTAPILQPDLAAVYVRQCNDQNGGLGGCTGVEDVTWATDPNGINVPNAAAEVFGPNEPRTVSFRNAGSTYGVTR